MVFEGSCIIHYTTVSPPELLQIRLFKYILVVMAKLPPRVKCHPEQNTTSFSFRVKISEWLLCRQQHFTIGGHFAIRHL